MDKAIILGTFDFLGFHFCNVLLDMGYEVEGVYYSFDDTDSYMKHKKLEIGRNANFQERMVNEEDKIPLEFEEEKLILLDGYEWFIKNNRRSLNRRIYPFSDEKILKNIQLSNSIVIFLLPIQTLLDNDNSNIFKNTKKKLEEMNVKYYFIYLPTVYGPWQPKEFAFQQKFLRELDNNLQIKVNEREWKQDAIYIGNIHEIIWKILDKGSCSNYYLQSDNNNQWEECASILQIEINGIRKNITINMDYVTVMNIKPITSVEIALKKQKNQLIKALTN